MRCTLPGAPPAQLPHPTSTLLQTCSSCQHALGLHSRTCPLPRPAPPHDVGKLCSLQPGTHTAFQRGIHDSASPLLGPALPLMQTCMCGDMHLHHHAQPRRSRAEQACLRWVARCAFWLFPSVAFCYIFVLQVAALPGTCCVCRAVAGHHCASTPHRPVHACADFNLSALGSPSALGRRPSP